MTKTILIDAGHGGTDPGAVSGRFIESELNLTVAAAARDYLADYDCETVMTRTDNTGVSIDARTLKAKAIGAAAVVSIHHNAGSGDGCEAFYWHTDNRAKELAEEIISRFKLLGQNSRGVKPSSAKAYNFGMCRINAKNAIPAVLAEFAFLDNAKDRLIIDTQAKLIAEGRAYGEALASYLKLSKKKLEPAAAPVEGSKIKLKNAPLFVSASSSRAVRMVTGNYWLYDGVLVLNRYRITNNAANAGKKPVGQHVTGWIDSAAVSC